MILYYVLPWLGKTGPGARKPNLGNSVDESECCILNPRAIASSAACCLFSATLSVF